MHTLQSAPQMASASLKKPMSGVPRQAAAEVLASWSAPMACPVLASAVAEGSTRGRGEPSAAGGSLAVPASDGTATGVARTVSSFCWQAQFEPKSHASAQKLGIHCRETWHKERTMLGL
jgi:hypothetical protein